MSTDKPESPEEEKKPEHINWPKKYAEWIIAIGTLIVVFLMSLLCLGCCSGVVAFIWAAALRLYYG